MRSAAVILTAFLISACATTGPETPDIQPVEQALHSEIDVAALMAEGEVAYELENYTECRTAFKTIVLRDDANWPARIGLGNCALALGDTDLAFQSFDGDLPEDAIPDTLRAVDVGRALTEVMSRTSEDPFQVLEGVIEHADDDPRLWNALGRLYDEKEQWLSALDCYVSALATGRASSSVINNMGMSLMRQGRFKEAKIKFAQAIELKPDSRLYDNNRRMTLFLAGDLVRGLKDLPDARAANLLNDAGFIAMQQDRTALAKLLFEEAIKTSPTYLAKAEENLERLLDLSNGSAEG